ncbi:hypothetical protein BDR07DRAFT_1422540 [Suillus spraguei]|nr:hypothetical protein BDR07DRAFT_1424221 [Suillus spraguei]KAG2356685.1 hypothetical protein BDR07DRAFT_1422540 [Suillus spraguei]
MQVLLGFLVLIALVVLVNQRSVKCFSVIPKGVVLSKYPVICSFSLTPSGPLQVSLLLVSSITRLYIPIVPPQLFNKQHGHCIACTQQNGREIIY